MDETEQPVFLVSSLVGIGVGLTVDYGAAQRIYVKRGYIPDGCGLMTSGHPVAYFQSILVDDDLRLYFTKNLKNKTS